MVYHGRVKNGLIVLEGDARLPEGAQVRVDVVSNREPDSEASAGPTLYDALQSCIGSAKNLPPDAARNIDHYLYGHPKQ